MKRYRGILKSDIAPDDVNTIWIDSSTDAYQIKVFEKDHWITPDAQTMQKVNTLILAANQTLQEAKTKAAAAETKANEASQKATAAESSASTASTAATTAQSALASTVTKVDQIKAAIEALPDGQAVSATVAEHTVKITNLESKVDEVYLTKKLVKTTENLFDKEADRVEGMYYVKGDNTLLSNSKCRLILLSNDVEAGERYAFNIFCDSTFASMGVNDVNFICSETAMASGISVSRGSSSTTNKRAQVTIPNGCGYLYLYINALSSSSLTMNEIVETICNGLVFRESASYVNEYIPHKLCEVSEDDIATALANKINSVPTASQVGAVALQQGSTNKDKILVVGADGRVTLATNTPSGSLVGYEKQEVSKTLYLGANVLDGIVGSGDGWSHNSGVYSHSSGNNALVFNVATISGEDYVVIFKTGIAEFGENRLNVSIGDGYVCDAYNGHTDFVVGMTSDGGYLKFTPNNYTSSVSSVELRKIVTESEAQKVVEIEANNMDSGTMADNITGWWNVSIGCYNTLSSNTNGSRNIAVGYGSLPSLKSGERNVAVGTFSMSQLEFGHRNIAIGADSLYTSKQSFDSIAIGKASLGSMSHPKFNGCIGIGTDAIGCVGDNVAYNIAIGVGALKVGTTNSARNVCVGHQSGNYATSDNVNMGYRAGYFNRGDNNINIGTNSGVGENATDKTLTYTIAIGRDAHPTKSNQCVIGKAGVEVVFGNKKLIFNADGSVTWETI